MLKQRARALAVVIFLIDLALVSLAFLGAFLLRDQVLPRLLPGPFPNSLYPLSSYLPLLPLALTIWAALFLRSGRYRSHRTVAMLAEVGALARVCAVGTVVFALAIYILRLDSLLLENDLISRPWILLFGVLSFVFLAGEKVALRATSRYVRARGYNYRTVLIVGTGNAAAEIVDSIENHRYWGFKVLGFVTADGTLPPEELQGRYPVLGRVEDIPAVVDHNVVDDVIFAVSRRELDQLDELLLSLHEQGIRTQFALNFLPHPQARVQLENLDGIPILTFATGPTNQTQLLFKRGVDLAVGGLLFVVNLPLMALIAAVIKLTSKGEVLFRQTRCGLNGRRFTVHKFRTMVNDAEDRRSELLHLNEMDGPVFKLRRDPRVTRFGRFLRKFSLDELPQLWNVLVGDMSLVGPRPPLPEEVAKYARWQRRRLSMKPGLTCLWQISGRNEVNFDRWMELDLEYIDTWSPSLDFKILLKTIPVVLSGKGAS